MTPHDLPAELAAMNREDLLEYLAFLLHNYRVMDAFWFINLERDLGLDEACRYNELVWSRVAQLAARDLKERYPSAGGGLKGWLELLRLFPWSILVGYQYDIRPDEAAPEEIIINVPDCPAQRARLDKGLGEYPCQAMHRGEFEGFTREIDPRIKVECLFAPPDEHPPETFCRWRFSLADGPA